MRRLQTSITLSRGSVRPCFAYVPEEAPVLDDDDDVDELLPESVSDVALYVPFAPELPSSVTESPGSTLLPLIDTDFLTVVVGSTSTLTVVPSDSFT